MAVALVFHVVGTLPVLVTGLALFAREGLTLKQIEREAASEEAAGDRL